MICDGISVADNLRPETRDLLARHELKYRHPTTKEKCEKWLGVTDPDSETLERLKTRSPFVFTIEKKDRYVRTFTTPALHKPMFSDKLAYGSFILVARYLHKLRNWPTFEDDSEIPDEVCEDIQRVCDEQTVRHHWKKHDLLMLDNTRFLHARPDIRRASKRLIWTQFGYANYARLSKEETEVQRWRRMPLWIEDEW